MKKFILAACLLVAFAGVSMAQTAPASTSGTHAKKSAGMHKHGGKHGGHHGKKGAAKAK